MKWDYAGVTVWGLDEKAINGQNRFDNAVVDLAYRLGGEIETAELLNGYRIAVKITRDGEKLVHCLTAGTGQNIGGSHFIAAHTASEVYPIIQDMFPDHAVARLDACEDYTGPGTWDQLEKMLTQVCSDFNVSMAPFGEGHIRPDGSRDATKGRTWYCGSKNSAFRIVLYEKGLEQLAKGIKDDPFRVRLEVRIRPASKAKELVGRWRPKPVDLLGMSRWGKRVGEYLGAADLNRMAIGSTWKASDNEQLAMKIVRMFERGIEKALAENSDQQLGQMLREAFRTQQEVKAAKNSGSGVSPKETAAANAL